MNIDMELCGVVGYGVCVVWCFIFWCVMVWCCVVWLLQEYKYGGMCQPPAMQYAEVPL